MLMYGQVLGEAAASRNQQIGPLNCWFEKLRIGAISVYTIPPDMFKHFLTVKFIDE